MSAVTAQTLYRDMMNSKVAPFLRGQGFARKGQQFTRTTNGYLEFIGFQKNQWNTEQSVSFTVNVSVRPPDAQQEEREIARWLAALEPGRGHVRVVPNVGSLGVRLGHLLPEGRDTWWTFQDQLGMNEAAHAVLVGIADFALPRMAVETAKPLVTPMFQIETN